MEGFGGNVLFRVAGQLESGTGGTVEVLHSHPEMFCGGEIKARL
jgi:hypothetical protein